MRSGPIAPPGRWVAAAAALALLACDGDAPGRADVAAARSAATGQCEGEDAHTKHVNLGFACETCHPKGGEFGAGGTLPGGTPVTGTITRSAPTTCAVSCHSPLGAPAQTIAWNAGALTCVSCHTQTLVAGARSAHAPGTDRSACLVCHDASAHLSGAVRLTVGNGTSGNAACLSCHSGAGKPIAGKAPPVVVEFGLGGSDAHGDGGVEPARPCRDCHDTHASTSAFLLGSRSDPTPLPPSAVASRAGIGGEALCGRCHAQRHQACSTVCHVHDGSGDRIIHVSDPAPAGTACFACHGHEGVVRGDERQGRTDFYGYFAPAGCKHCHGAAPNLPAVESTPPDVTMPIFSNDGIATATVTWTSLEAGTTYVEYGDLGVLQVRGDASFRLAHSVQLPGLSPSRPQEVRIKTADRMRNVAFTATEVLTIGAPATPTPNRFADYVGCAVTPPIVLSWSAATDPNGDALVYDIQVSDSPRFETLLSTGTSAVGATTYTVWLGATYDGRNYYWRVRAREAGSQGLASTWSGFGSFWAYIDPWC